MGRDLKGGEAECWSPTYLVDQQNLEALRATLGSYAEVVKAVPCCPALKA